jgi:transcription elongation factor GreB
MHNAAVASGNRNRAMSGKDTPEPRVEPAAFWFELVTPEASHFRRRSTNVGLVTQDHRSQPRRAMLREGRTGAELPAGQARFALGLCPLARSIAMAYRALVWRARRAQAPKEPTMAGPRAGRGPKSNYITPEGEKRLRDELNHLWSVERPKVTQEVADAAAQGDRSENAEYIYGKKRLREIDRRIEYLAHRLDKLTVVRDVRASKRVFFGAWVRLENEQGQVQEFRIVGPDETQVDAGSISIDSPMGRALMRKEEGDEVVVSRPKGDAAFLILRVQYTPFSRDG